MAFNVFMVRDSSLSVQEASTLLVKAWRTSSDKVSSLPLMGGEIFIFIVVTRMLKEVSYYS